MFDFIIKDGVLVNFRWDNLKIRNVVVPDTVKKIASRAFAMCKGIESIILPPTITEIGSQAFSGCFSLKSINLPGSLVKLGSEAFRNCSSLEMIKIPISVPEIREFTFCNCTSLQEVELSDQIKSIEDHAFYGCKSLKKVYIPKKLSEISSFTFCGCTSLKYVVIPEGVKCIRKSAFWGCSMLEEVKLPSSITEIEDYAFRDCENLTTIELPESIETMGKNVFADCRRLEISVPNDYSELRGSLAGLNIKQKQVAEDKIELEVSDDIDQAEEKEEGRTVRTTQKKQNYTIRSFTEVAKPKYYSPGSMFVTRNVCGYDISTTVYNWDRVPRPLIERMIETHNFEAEMYLPMKYCIVAAVFLKDKHTEAESYIWRNTTDIICYFINANDYETVKGLFESGKFVTSSNITTLLECAVDKVQNGGDMKIQMLINNYYLIHSSDCFKYQYSESISHVNRQYLYSLDSIERRINDIRMMVCEGADRSVIMETANDLFGQITDFMSMIPNELAELFDTYNTG